VDKEGVKPAAQSATAAEWRIVDRNRIVIRYEFASRRWSGQAEAYADATGKFGEPRDLAPAQIETIRRCERQSAALSEQREQRGLKASSPQQGRVVGSPP
jgi:hypothetical protein